MDILISADLDPCTTFEILSGPYPEYLERWHVRDRFSTTFSPAQIEALYDWQGRHNRRLFMDGDGVRLIDQSAWFDS